MTELTTPLARAVRGKDATALEKDRGLRTVADLLWFLPRRYLDRHTATEDFVDGDYAVFIGEVVSSEVKPMRGGRHKMQVVKVRTEQGNTVDITFFRIFRPHARLVRGFRALFAGKVGTFRDRWQLTHPVFEPVAGQPATLDSPDAPDTAEPEGNDPAGLLARDIVPIYLEVKGVPSWTISRHVETLLDELAVPDPVPEEILADAGMPTFLEAMRLVHCPADRGDVGRGKRRLKYDEALLIQLVLAGRRREQAHAPAVPRRPVAGGLLEAFDARLPFELTAGQRAVGEQIAEDLARTHPMHRLLQGEVGSGKTVVALRAMLAVVDAGGQAALLAPTEVLAAQHHRSITAMLGDLAEGGLLGGADQGTRVALLTGSQPAAARKQALLQAASGEAGIVIGTHALIQEHVQLADLGLVVVDEQHRFGVEQRDALRGKAKEPPHVLVMTATPIPRTVAMTVFGDMDTSVLDELPRGRSPITSHVVDNPRWYERAWGRVAEEIAAGHQAYVVCPRIGEDDANEAEAALAPLEGEEAGPVRPLRGVVEVLEELRATPALAGRRIELLHGRLPSEQKDATMNAFAAGEIDVLVSTTVVEVGVDVPNATAMVVLDADRFGVSQLHQLRGRVGRGSAPGLCLLVAQGAEEPALATPPGAPPSASVARLRAVAATTDGFELSRLDLEQRREGDILGARQSGGVSGLQLLSLRGRDDEAIIERARVDAARILDDDPDLSGHPRLRALVAERLDEEQAAFLERG